MQKVFSGYVHDLQNFENTVGKLHEELNDGWVVVPTTLILTDQKLIAILEKDEPLKREAGEERLCAQEILQYRAKNAG